MDPFGAESELVNIHTAFVQGQYQTVIDEYDATSFSAENKFPIQVLQYRAQCALGRHSEVLEAISEEDAAQNPDLSAVRIYASYLQTPNDTALHAAEALSESPAAADSLTVQLLIGTVLARAGKADAALSLLSKHQGSLDAVALIVQILLSQNRTDLALQEARSARSFAQDALLVNLAESWIAMRQGGDNYQKAFYVFEELAQAPSSASAASLVAQAVSELHMGRVEEAETALDQALVAEPGNSTAVANKLVLETILGRDTAALRETLEMVDKDHEMLVEFAAKREAFQAARAKYNPKFEP